MTNDVLDKSVVLSVMQNNIFENKDLQLYDKRVILSPRHKLKRGVSMAASNLVQFRINTKTREKATDICDELGIDLPTYLRMCVTRLVKEEGIPFNMSLNRRKESSISEVLDRANREAEANGVSEMSLEEINAEINAARRERSW